jgi:hypothetical protein
MANPNKTVAAARRRMGGFPPRPPRPKFYASLTGPLLGLYYPLPDELETREQRGIAMNTSKLKSLWCSIYPEGEVDIQLLQFGGSKLPDECAGRLDYDYYAVFAEVAS